MANVHKQFEAFHEAIRLEDENETLREKRDIILEKLRRRLKERFPDAPSFETFVQGSYAMGTGIRPLEGDYDIDVGIAFDIAKENHGPIEAKNWVYESLLGHTASVEMKTSCVRVTYGRDGEPLYHVDLAVYAASNSDGMMYLAKGRRGSDQPFWEPSDPKRFISLIRDRYSDSEDRAQFRRVIRYLKRWKDIKFEDRGHSSPTGIALTVCAFRLFAPKRTVDAFSNTRRYNDLEAVTHLVSGMLSSFRPVPNDAGGWSERLVMNLPVAPGHDLFARMTDGQMAVFREKLSSLLEDLQHALDQVDPVEACKTLHCQFGDDFPVPAKEDTAQRRRPAVSTHSASATS